ncbi:MAG: hypothetical protein Q8R08_04335 [bacterium]|nr:hypothetical protein [bacterium]
MNTITIPKTVTKGEELVILPRREYEAFSRWQKSIKRFTPTATQVRDLARARADYRQGKYITLNELKRKLATRGKR